MDPELMRARLRQFIKTRELTINEWCQRARIEPGALYAFVNGRTNDVGASRLIALADAESCSLDEMFGRAPMGRDEALLLAAPIIEAQGVSVSFLDLARLTGLRTSVLQSIWSTMDDLVTATYLHVVARAVPAHFGAARADGALERVHEAGAAAVDWAAPRLPLMLAFQAAILRTSPHRRAEYQAMRRKAADLYWTMVLAPARDLIPLDKAQRFDLAQALLDASLDAVRHNIDAPRKILQDYKRRSGILLLRKIVI